MALVFRRSAVQYYKFSGHYGTRVDRKNGMREQEDPTSVGAEERLSGKFKSATSSVWSQGETCKPRIWVLQSWQILHVPYTYQKNKLQSNANIQAHAEDSPWNDTVKTWSDSWSCNLNSRPRTETKVFVQVLPIFLLQSESCCNAHHCNALLL